MLLTKAIPTGILLGLLAACQSPAGPGQQVAGLYVLRTLDGLALPTGAPCGVYDIVSASLTLDGTGTATLTREYRAKSDSARIYFVGTGPYSTTSSDVTLQLQGGWSHSDWRGTTPLLLERAQGELRLRRVGAECDASSTEAFGLVAPL